MTDKLNTELHDLKDTAEKQTNDYKSSKDLLYQTLVNSYLWWRKASDEEGYLDQLYEAAKIKANGTGNQANFSPLIKLVWGMTEMHDATIAQWNSALRVIDQEYIDNKAEYDSDPSTRLVNYIHDAGGLAALRQKAGDYDEEEKTSKRGKLNPVDAKVRTKEIEAGIAFFEKAPSKAAVAISEPFLATKDGLVAAVGRINQQGAFELLATSDDDALVSELAADCADADISHVPANLRLLAEVIATQALPAKLARFRKGLTEYSDIPVPNAAAGKKVMKTALPRLLVRPGKGDMLLSNARCNNVSVVTRARPKTPLAASGDDFFLNGNDRSMIEAAYIQKRQLRHMTGEPGDSVKAADDTVKAAFCIDTAHAVTEKKRALYFYDIPGNERDHQADYNDAPFTPVWKYDLNLDWLKHLQVDFVGWWINHHGPHICRKKNKSFTVNLSDKAWAFAWGEKEERKHLNKAVQLRGTCTATGVNGGVGVNVLSKDFLCVFSAIAATPLASQIITVEGDAHMMKVSYATSLADYEVFIPFCNSKHERDQTHFKNV